MNNAELERWFKPIKDAIQEARMEAGNEKGLRSLVEAVQLLTEVVQEVCKKGGVQSGT